MKVTPFGKKHEATEKKLQFAAGSSDHLTMLNAYNVSITDKYMQEILLAKTWLSTGSLVQELWYINSFDVIWIVWKSDVMYI